MKIIFAGTPDFAVPALTALVEAGHEIILVLTQPDRPAGRGMKLKSSPVKELAVKHHLHVFQPETLKNQEVRLRIAESGADVMVVAAYGLIIPEEVLKMPRYGCYNIHASLLPRWRGAAPIQRAILAGDKETGVTIMEVVPALDAGAMVMKGILPIGERDTAQSLHDAMARMGAELMVKALQNLEIEGSLASIPQDESMATYAAKLQKQEAVIDWNKSAPELSRQVRAFNPFPVAQTLLNGEVCRIWMAVSQPGKGKPGLVSDVSDGILIGCGEGLLKVEELQMPGGNRMKAKDFLAGRPLSPGQPFGS